MKTILATLLLLSLALTGCIVEPAAAIGITATTTTAMPISTRALTIATDPTTAG